MPGGLLSARFGDRAVVLSALGLMTLGGAAYAGMAVAPVTAGYLVDRGGGVAALWLAVAMWLAALPALGLFRALQRRWIYPRPA